MGRDGRQLEADCVLRLSLSCIKMTDRYQHASTSAADLLCCGHVRRCLRSWLSFFSSVNERKGCSASTRMPQIVLDVPPEHAGPLLAILQSAVAQLGAAAQVVSLVCRRRRRRRDGATPAFAGRRILPRRSLGGARSRLHSRLTRALRTVQPQQRLRLRRPRRRAAARRRVARALGRHPPAQGQQPTQPQRCRCGQPASRRPQ